MNKTMLVVIMFMVAIILMVAFDIQLIPHPNVNISAANAPNALFVCPVADQTWDSVANSFKTFSKFFTFGLFFAAIVITAIWLWALYQNLLKDKFDKKSFSNPWTMTKALFWITIGIIIILHTPNHFRTVHLPNGYGDRVLCEQNSPGAMAVRASAVKP